MKVLKTPIEVSTFLEEQEFKDCLADTNFLFGLSFDEDRLFNRSTECFEQLAELGIGIHINAIARMEFLDVLFRDLITQGAIELYQQADPKTTHKSLFRQLKYIRDKKSENSKKGYSFRVGERDLKGLRKELMSLQDGKGWENFCNRYTKKFLINEWSLLEEDLGLSYLDGQNKEYFESPLLWGDLVRLMGEKGMRGPDAMIMNFFEKSKIPLLITGDSDFETSISDDLKNNVNKAIYLL